MVNSNGVSQESWTTFHQKYSSEDFRLSRMPFYARESQRRSGGVWQAVKKCLTVKSSNTAGAARRNSADTQKFTARRLEAMGRVNSKIVGRVK
jgi:hypothetical protein